jgi:hypothetical protein
VPSSFFSRNTNFVAGAGVAGKSTATVIVLVEIKRRAISSKASYIRVTESLQCVPLYAGIYQQWLGGSQAEEDSRCPTLGNKHYMPAHLGVLTYRKVCFRMYRETSGQFDMVSAMLANHIGRKRRYLMNAEETPA